MYDYGRRVYVKSQKQVGTISERNYIGKPRRASYIVDFGEGRDFMTGSSDLRPADWCCDACGGWRTGSPAATGPDGEYAGAIWLCWLCAGPPAEREGRRLEDKFYTDQAKKDLANTVREALEGDSNDAEHDALVQVAEALGISYKVTCL